MDNVDIVGCIVPHLGPWEVNRLLRCSRSVRSLVQSHEEAVWSRTGVVRTYRCAALQDGKLQFQWIRQRTVKCFEADPIKSARGIVTWLWDLKMSKNHEECALFVKCMICPEFLSVPVPCFLFATQGSEEKWPRRIGIRQYEVLTQI
jgi:hypothetical protein